MNIDDHFSLSHHLLPAIYSFYTQHSKTGIVYIFIISNNQSLIITSQFFGVFNPLGEILKLFIPLEFDVQTNSDHKNYKIKLYSVRALKRYLSERNLIHGRVMATMLKFSPQNFETYLRVNRVNRNRGICKKESVFQHFHT